ncbi:hypothetical protein [Flavobacterium phage FPSV-S1]|nr:hypothetical protein [Flavobacterium phage FPSV-S1]QCW20509.1 hypothetical protein [Flavobacterium phage FPSV-S8]
MDFKSITKDSRGCLPIFYVEVSAHWRKSLNTKKFEATATVKLVYKGLPNIAATKKLKKDFFRYHNDGKKVSDITLGTFVITEYKILAHLGYERQPFNDN